MKGYGIRPEPQGFFYGAYLDLGIGIGAEDGACRQMDDKPYVLAASAVAGAYHSLVKDDAVGTPFDDIMNGLLHVYKAEDGAHGGPVIHRYDDGFS